MRKTLIPGAIFLFAWFPIVGAASPAEQHVIEAIKSPALNPKVRFSVISSEVWQPCAAVDFDLEAIAGLHFAALDRLADDVTTPLS